MDLLYVEDAITQLCFQIHQEIFTFSYLSGWKTRTETKDTAQQRFKKNGFHDSKLEEPWEYYASLERRQHNNKEKFSRQVKKNT